MMATVVLVLVAGFASLSWLSYIGNAHRAAARDRDQLPSFYAAESGIEQLIVYFNHHDQFPGPDPDVYTTELATHPNTIPMKHGSVIPDRYDLFEPYLLDYKLGPDNLPQYINGELQVLRRTFFRDPAAGDSVAVSRTSKIPSFFLDLSNNPMLTFRTGKRELARVDSIEVINPNDLEDDELLLLPDGMRVICKVISTGVTPLGVRTQIASFVSENPVYDVRSPGAIITRATATFNGQANVYWGEMWTGGDIHLMTNFLQKLPRYTPDETFKTNPKPIDHWFALRTEGVIKDSTGVLYADGRVDGGFSVNPISEALNPTLFKQPYHKDFMLPKNKTNFEGYSNMYQNQDLDFPRYSYQDWKSFVVTSGFGYYFTGPDGTVFGKEKDSDSPDFGKIVGKTYDEWFGATPDQSNYWEVKDIVAFVDTIPVNDAGQVRLVDGVPLIDKFYYPRDPNKDGRMATIRLAGGGLHTRGAMFVAANMDCTGQGNPPRWQDIPESAGGGVRMPNGEPPPSGTTIRIFHHGLMYVWGNVSNAGSRTVFGSIFAEGGFGSAGSPEVYYNYRMGDGSWLNLNVSVVNRNLWDVSKPK